MRVIYSLLYYLALPFMLLGIAWYRLCSKSFPLRLGERFAWYAKPPATTGEIWVHASSVGEVNAAAPLIKSLRRKYPQVGLLLTTQTLTGSDCAQKLFGDSIKHLLAPFDLPGSVARFLQTVQPSLCVIMETELWPNMLSQCHERGIPMLLASARLSKRSLSRYRYLKGFCKTLLSYFQYILAQSDQDATRFLELGAPPAKLRRVGNIKYTFQVTPDMQLRAKQASEQIGSHKSVWIAASTHLGEEEVMLQALQLIKRASPNVVLVLVPRHPERCRGVFEACQRYGFSSTYRSEMDGTFESDVLVVDTVGECPFLYGIATVAFVGGSIAQIGGHNPIEPAAWGLPVLSGPHTHNFAAIEAEFKQAGVLETVETALQLAENVLKYLNDPQLCAQHALRTKELLAGQQSALQEHLLVIQDMMGEQNAL